jgi:hypothetical protein
MSDKEAIGVGVAFAFWGALLLMLNKPLSQAYREFWPDRFGTHNSDRGWHRKQLIVIAVLLLIFGVATLISGLI